MGALQAAADFFLLHCCYQVAVGLHCGRTGMTISLLRDLCGLRPVIIVEVTTWLIAPAVRRTWCTTRPTVYQQFILAESNAEQCIKNPRSPSTLALISVTILNLLLCITVARVSSVHLALQIIAGKTYNHSLMVK
ncbi:hypothetical protein C8F01DRAFT_1120825 [Mycena amicta]|nr:hypothetical protein C8F01DRAFT_1120825 [Mycena amicta]